MRRNSATAVCIWCLLATNSALAAQPDTQSFSIDIPSQAMDSALESLARQTGASVGMAGRMPNVRTRTVRGSMTALSALEAMLQGASLVVVEIAPLSFRLEPKTSADAGDALTDAAPASLEEIVITGTKRAQDWFTSPLPIAVLGSEDFKFSAPLMGTRAALQASSSTSSTNLGPGRNRQFIRGIADSAFNGPSQSTVSVHLDEARLNFDAPDPDLRQVDVARIEVLKGPQGPLYGTGALGGIFHIVTNRPDLMAAEAQAAIYGSALDTGGAGGGASLVVNAPLSAERLGLRAVAYVGEEPGWIDNLQGRNNANSAHVAGGRLALRAQPSQSWTLDLSGVAQSTRVDDSQYAIAGFPGYQRDGISPEPHDGDFYMGLFTATGTMGAVNILLTTSSIYQEVNSTLDASAAAPEFGLTGKIGYEDARTYHLFNQELRLTGVVWSMDWLAGAALMSARSHVEGSVETDAGASLPEVALAQHAQEIAAFGELHFGVVPGVHATAGLRVSSTSIEDELGGEAGEGALSRSTVSVTPSLAVDWQPTNVGRYYYFRFAQAERPGGLSPGAGTEDHQFDADSLSSFNLGGRFRMHDDSLTLDTALFAARWKHIQSDYLLPSGIVATHNVGDGDNYGWEATLRWRPEGPWSFDADMTLQQARLTHPEIDVADDPRLPIVPDFRARAVLGRTVSMGNWAGVLSGELGYTGPSRLSFEEALDRKMGEFATMAMALGLTKPGWSLLARVDNATNSRADTFAYGNPFSVRTVEQHTPLQPRTLTLSVTHSFDR
ncbi:MAG: TonB-dependent receptor plug domain-containing protein [Pseudomonadota bacterium]